MPKETFLNLDESKRKKIFDAAVKEFTNYELHKCRVSSIIKEAGIPRGSFYQYFEDLDDLYYYVVDDVFDRIFDDGYKYSQLTNDIFEYAILTFEVDYQGFTCHNRHRFIRNVMKSIGSNIEYLEHHNMKRKNYILEILERMDLSKIRIKGQKDKIRLYELIQSVKRIVIQKSLMDKLTKTDAMELLKWHLNILENGLVIKEEQHE